MTRPATTADIDLANRWAEARCAPAIPVSMLPRDGVVYGDPAVAMAWLYIDTSARVGFPHWLITLPGLSLSETREAVAGIFQAFDHIAYKEGVHTLVATVHEEGIAREAINQFGFLYLGQGATLWRPCRL